MSQKPTNSSSPWIDCLFSSLNFRDGHGLSVVASTTVVSNLVSVGAFSDEPRPLRTQHSHGLEPTYRIVPVDGKGTGVVAVRNIRRGEIIMVDVPALLIGVTFLAETKPHHRRRILRQAIRQLPEETQTKIYRLHRGASKYEIDAILGPNSNTVTLGDDEAHVGLFTEVARINHSCRPNAYYRFSERRLTMEVITYHAINAGEEILVSYVPIETPIESRRQYLKSNWEFDCGCALCRGSEADIEDSESWRRRMKSLKASVLSAREEGFYQDAINMVEDWLMFAELDRVPPLLAEYHGTLADLYFLNGDMANATRYARMAVDGWAKLGSVDDDNLERARLFLNHLNQLNAGKQ
ncbi:hypothetical protein VTK26DRAFT_8625 [Humicola hyalothermophila]